MDTRQIDEAFEDVSFDLVCEWISAAFRRAVGRTKPPGCPWGSLVMALDLAGVGGSTPLTERGLRRHLVDAYRQQSPEERRATMDAKQSLGCGAWGPWGATWGPGGWGSWAQNGDVEDVHALWPWYLYCLTFATGDHLEEGAVLMPLDLVDLQVLATRLRVAVTVSQMMAQPVRLQPSGAAPPAHAVHMVHHRGHWAALLGNRVPEREGRPLVDALVELGECAFGTGPDGERQFPVVEDGGRCVGVVVSHELEHYSVRVGLRKFVVERSQITRVVYHPSAGSESQSFGGHFSEADTETYHGDELTLLRGVPHSSLEWHLLHELVRRGARASLENLKGELAGREDAKAKNGGRPGNWLKPHGPVPELAEADASALPRQAPIVASAGHGGQVLYSSAPSLRGVQATVAHGGAHVVPTTITSGRPHEENPQDAGASVGDGCWYEKPHAYGAEDLSSWRIPLADLVRRVKAGDELSVFAVSDFAPVECRQMPLRTGEVIKVEEVKDRWVLGVPSSTSKSCGIAASEAWCPRDALTVWQASQRFSPTEVHNHPDWANVKFLQLEVGDSVVVSRRYDDDWYGWAYARRWPDGAQGLVSLQVLEPKVLVSGYQWEA